MIVKAIGTWCLISVVAGTGLGLAMARAKGKRLPR